MRAHESINWSDRMWGVFLFFQLAYLVALSASYFSEGRWELASLLLLGVVVAAVIGGLALRATVRVSRDTGGAGLEGAGKPVPVRPAPSHHLAAAKDLPPLEQTHSLPKD